VTASWVIVEKAIGRAILETYNAEVPRLLNITLYQAVPILEYLQGLNHRIAEREIVTSPRVRDCEPGDD